MTAPGVREAAWQVLLSRPDAPANLRRDATQEVLGTYRLRRRLTDETPTEAARYVFDYASSVLAIDVVHALARQLTGERAVNVYALARMLAAEDVGAQAHALTSRRAARRLQRLRRDAEQYELAAQQATELADPPGTPATPDELGARRAKKEEQQ